MVCSSVLEAVDSSKQFCQMMGYKVISPSEDSNSEQSELECFSGIP